jgi:hypothetical protein
MGESSYVAHGCREVFLDPIFGPTCRRVSLCLFTSLGGMTMFTRFHWSALILSFHFPL